MTRVLVTRALPTGGLEPLVGDGHDVVQRAGDTPYTQAELTELVATVDAVVCLLTDRIDEPVLEAGAASHLRVVANVAVGYDNIDVDAARRLGVAVCNTPGVLDETTADAAFLLVLAASRLASEAERDLRRGAWSGWASTSTSATTSTAPRSGSSATGVSAGRWRAGPRDSACRCSTTPVTPPTCPATWDRSTTFWPRVTS